MLNSCLYLDRVLLTDFPLGIEIAKLTQIFPYLKVGEASFFANIFCIWGGYILTYLKEGMWPLKL